MVSAVLALSLAIAVATFAVCLSLRTRALALKQIREQNQQLLKLIQNAKSVSVVRVQTAASKSVMERLHDYPN